MAHNRLSNYRTTWTETNGRGSVVYVHTPIVEWNEDTITLKSGGWERFRVWSIPEELQMVC